MLLSYDVGEDLRGPWTARRSSQSILKEINPEYSLEELMLKLQFIGHLMRRTHSFEKILMLRKTEVSRRQDNRRQDGWMVSPTQHTWVWVSAGRWRIGKPACCNPWGLKELDLTEWLNTTCEILRTIRDRNSGYFNICFSMNSIEQSSHSKNNCLHLLCMGYCVLHMRHAVSPPHITWW